MLNSQTDLIIHISGPLSMGFRGFKCKISERLQTEHERCFCLSWLSFLQLRFARPQTRTPFSRPNAASQLLSVADGRPAHQPKTPKLLTGEYIRCEEFLRFAWRAGLLLHVVKF